uniref:Solute carrier family 2 member 2 n=1 Tax=Molossus molossus TaxID=27622 RepID=A0A7J8I1W1_MOLMO|nr:solute carrier family 2 member 2 [Molossus molossus]
MVPVCVQLCSRWDDRILLWKRYIGTLLWANFRLGSHVHW